MSQETVAIGRKISTDYQLTDVPQSESIQKILVDHIRANPSQVRTEFLEESIQGLAQSIQSQGLLLPIIVKEIKEASSHRYEIVAGERRFRAIKKLGHTHIQAIVRNYSDAAIRINQLIENAQRENLSIHDKSKTIAILVDRLGSVEKVVEQTGLSVSLVYKYNRIGKSEPLVFDLVKKAELGVNQSNLLVSLVEHMRRTLDTGLSKHLGKLLEEPVGDIDDLKITITALAAKYLNGANKINPATAAKKEDVQIAPIALPAISSTPTQKISLNLEISEGSNISKEDKEKLILSIKDFLMKAGISVGDLN